VIAATLGQFALLWLIVFGVFSGAAIACASVGAVGSLLADLVLRRGSGTRRRRLALSGAAAGVAGGFVGVVGLGIASTMWSSGVSAMVPVALVSALVAGSVAGIATIRSAQAGQLKS
jgi:hypothetical protein